MPLRRLDLLAPAENGLRRGRTTGSCATAAVKAALLLLRHEQVVTEVDVSLPDGEHFLTVPVGRVERLADGAVRAEVLKDGGDDPDSTHGATITAVVRENTVGELRFLAGAGVGTVTQPGIRVPVGEPAINPTPRAMMRRAVAEVLPELASPGLDLEIGCVNGEEIARRTFNPRLGILGGISILGTTGVVEPMSQEAYMASVEVYVRVALGDRPDAVIFTPGKLGRDYARAHLKLDGKRLVQISNFVGYALDAAQTALQELNFELDTLWLAGHPGKLAKTIDGAWDTHSQRSPMAMPAVARVARDCGFGEALARRLEHANTVEDIIVQLEDPIRRDLWLAVENAIARACHARVPSVRQVQVRLFALDGTPLGAAA
ncbi:cobalt-precorrin-5B (C(1))-methyltransferase CbiD [Deinococcus peraridilitoris]|uniref:Cobalt-precorrin-5B C(1)-methyltransferase n=1 Tax=Deinococcus peraridilitoris (strain DSM 19664 / LMG 22246 / CIP 109416 / KR-200) TaxID=937777 RepID=L0A1L6_DEIPD|nr:cobalt-precorrin-5B (C(1))-methyltransferase CbiD [Deinococcus peraridilitoris]AFZ67788.1 cobalamin biosynthesis protein CbiD [Deinococcus peraridilitoris DSM 19664]